MNKKNLKKQPPTLAATFLIALTAVAAMLPAACSVCPDDALSGGGGNAPVTLGVSSVFVDGAESTTRTSATALTSGELQVGVRDGNGYKASEVTYQYKNGAWAPQKSLILNISNADLYAFHPASGFTSSGGVLTFSMQVYSAAQDLCYAKNSSALVVNIGNPEASFWLKHTYARVRLSVTRTVEFTGTGNITAYNLKAASGNIYLDGKLNLNDGTVATATPSSSGYTCGVNTTVAAGSTNTTCDMLVPPQVIPADGLSITLTIDGNARSATIPQANFGTNLVANNQYTVHLEIGANATLIVGGSSVTEEEWTAPTGDFGNIDHIAP